MRARPARAGQIMRIIGFSGKSGTGKSFASAELCGKLGIEAVIDDGLFIEKGNIIAGISAKKQPTRLGAVKTAIFTDEKHRSSVSGAIRESGITSIMVIGTSDRMVDEICERLEIGKPDEYIHIEDVSTPEQIEKARRLRASAGTHIIPAPTMQVKKQFSGYFLDPRKGFRKDEHGKGQSSEKTLVRPTYSYMGDFVISDKVISDIVEHLAKDEEAVSDVLWVASTNGEDGMYIRIIIRGWYGAAVRKAAESLQKRVWQAVSYMTAFNILGIEVEIREFNMKNEKSA